MPRNDCSSSCFRSSTSRSRSTAAWPTGVSVIARSASSRVRRSGWVRGSWVLYQRTDLVHAERVRRARGVCWGTGDDDDPVTGLRGTDREKRAVDAAEHVVGVPYGWNLHRLHAPGQRELAAYLRIGRASDQRKLRLQ